MAARRIAALVLFAAMLSTFASTGRAAEQKRVLFISSYHYAFHSVPNQIAGMTAGFKSAGYDASRLSLDIEFMDAKRIGADDRARDFRDYLAAKLAKLPPYDLIVVGDDDAFELARAERDGLFAGRPIVFHSVNNVASALATADDPRITGVVEQLSIPETLGFIEALQPAARKLYVVMDDTDTGRVNFAQFEAARGALKRLAVEVLSLETMTHGQFADRLATIAPSDAVLLTTAYRDHTGRTVDLPDVFATFRQRLRAPLYVLIPFAKGDGPVGGVIVSHFEQGRLAAQMAARILEGVPVADIPVVRKSPNPYVADVGEMDRFKLDTDRLPAGTVTLGGAETFFAQFRDWILFGGALVVLQTAFLVVLLARRFYRQRAEAVLAGSEKRFRDIASISSDWFWECDEDYRITSLSERFEAVTGQAPETRLGTTHLDFAQLDWNKERRSDWRAHLKDLDGCRPFRNFEYALPGANGEMRYERISGTPIFENGRFAGYRGTGTDITVELHARNQLLRAISEAELANRAKSAFLANMSHELRTPLNAIIGFSEILTGQLFGKLQNERYLEYARDINETGKHLLTVLNDLLDISRVEAGYLKLEESAIDVRQMVRSCGRMLGDRIKSAGLELYLDLPPETPALFGDETRLRQVLLNLMSNSIKFTPTGGRISIASRRTESGGLSITVEDTGVGIPAEDMERVLEPFQQAEQELSRHHGGVGLGLSLARTLTELHGGRLTLESEEGSWTRVTIALPADRVREIRPERPPRTPRG